MSSLHVTFQMAISVSCLPHIPSFPTLMTLTYTQLFKKKKKKYKPSECFKALLSRRNKLAHVHKLLPVMTGAMC